MTDSRKTELWKTLNRASKIKFAPATPAEFAAAYLSFEAGLRQRVGTIFIDAKAGAKPARRRFECPFDFLCMLFRKTHFQHRITAIAIAMRLLRNLQK